MDEGMRVVDADALARINQIIAEHAADLEMVQAAPGSVFILLVAIYLIKLGNCIIYFMYMVTNILYIIEEHQTKMVAKSLNLDDAEIEESKRDLITREIGKFREVMKVIIFIIIL